VLIATTFPASPLPATAPVHVVDRASAAAEAVRIAGVEASTRAALGIPTDVRVHLARAASAVGETSLRLVDRGATIAAATIVWKTGQRSATATLTWIPARTGAARLRVAVDRDAVDLLVDVRETGFAVHLTGFRASWNLAFVAAALREDHRLSVLSRIDTVPGRSVASVPEDSQTALPDVTIHAVDSITSRADVVRLHRLAGQGRTVVLVPDGEPSTAVREFVGTSRLAEQVLRAPVVSSNGLRASEWLVVGDINPATTVRATFRLGNRDRPAILELPVGLGRVVMVTAMDAWRYRADPGFERFWRLLVVELAAEQHALSARLRVTPAVARPGQPVIAWYEAPAPSTAKTIVLRLDCEREVRSTHTAVARGGRLFTARFHAPLRVGTCRLYTSNVADESVPLLVANDALQPERDHEPALRALANSHRGTFVHAAEVTQLSDTLRKNLYPGRSRIDARPMRWSGWIAVFAALVGSEWWLRRRKGLR
jgi:hypothetical protein